jgi:microcystin-dependent protein
MGNISPSLLAAPSSATAYARTNPGTSYTATATNLVQFDPQAIGPNGGGQPHNNLQPFLALSFCIALQGVFPPRT